MQIRFKYFFVGFFIFLYACNSSEKNDVHFHNQKGEYIYRHHDEYIFKHIKSPEKKTYDLYPWESHFKNNISKITKENFRCKGNSLNPTRLFTQKNGEICSYTDCGGTKSHSLPLKEKKEFIYPILIELLNHIQLVTEKQVIITSGHRCPTHNSYADSSNENQYSKHMIGAQVSFYVKEYEKSPEKIIKIVQDFYKKEGRKKDFVDFFPLNKGGNAPLANKEIIIRVYNEQEGRNFDNNHSYPYLSIEVCFDDDLQAKVFYSWDKAHRNYLRW